MWSWEELVCEQSPVPSAHRASLETRIELFGQLFFSSLHFLQSVQMWCCFYQIAARLPHPHTGCVSSGLHPIPTSQRWNVPSVYLAISFVQGGCNLPTSCAGLRGSPEGRWCVVLTWWVADSLGWKQVLSSTVLTSRSPRFCVHLFWQVQDIPDAFWTHSTVHCNCIFAFPKQDKINQKLKREKQISSGQTDSLACPSARVFLTIMCYKMLF
jgi:hypothetical protein